MHGTIKHRFLIGVTVGVGLWGLLFVRGCDTWYYLRHPISHETEITQTFRYGIIEIGGNTAMDYSDVALGVTILTDTALVVYADSLHVKHEHRSLNLNMRFEGRKLDKGIVLLKKGSNYIIYNQFFYPPFEFGERLTLYANNYIRVGEETFDIDTVQFEFTRLTEPSP